MAHINSLPTRQYLDNTVVPILLQAMAEVAKERPRYPVEFIINYLRANNPENEDKAASKNQSSSQKPKNKSPEKQAPK